MILYRRCLGAATRIVAINWIFIAALLCGVVACQPSQPSLSRLNEDAVILAFGDSLTYGVGASSSQDYPSILANLTGRKVINAGVSGEISAEGLQRLTGLLDETQPKLLLLIHGGNDILRNLPSQQTQVHLRAMIHLAKQRNIEVLMLGVPKLGLVLLHSADFYAELAQAEQIPLDDHTLPEILANNALKSDAIHPNDAGYRQMAERILELLHETGALQKPN
jgi:lysophospholipase L1-like esterase